MENIEPVNLFAGIAFMILMFYFSWAAMKKEDCEGIDMFVFCIIAAGLFIFALGVFVMGGV